MARTQLPSKVTCDLTKGTLNVNNVHPAADDDDILAIADAVVSLHEQDLQKVYFYPKYQIA